MRGCYRPLLVFAPIGGGPRLHEQIRLLDAAADDMMDRNLLFVPVLENQGKYQPPLDAPTTALRKADQAELRRRFHIAPGEWKAVLIGEDGGAKLESAEPLTMDKLMGTIDAMPTRKREMQQPHSN